MKNVILAAFVSAPLAVATVFNAGVASAATLNGGFQFDGSDKFVAGGEVLSPATTVKFNAQMLDFVTNPLGENPKISVKLGVEDFGFATDTIADIFDLTGLNATDGSKTTFNTAQKFIKLTDGTELWLESVSDFAFIDNVGSTDVNLGFMGYFLKDQMQTDATGSITFQVQDGIETVQDAVDNQLLNAAFSGTVATSAVPEPSTMLGLGLVGAASAFGLKKKNS